MEAREKWVELQKGNVRDPCGNGNILELYYVKVNSNIVRIMIFHSHDKCPISEIG
jgi:hypothetical protein